MLLVMGCPLWWIKSIQHFCSRIWYFYFTFLFILHLLLHRAPPETERNKSNISKQPFPFTSKKNVCLPQKYFSTHFLFTSFNISLSLSLSLSLSNSVTHRHTLSLSHTHTHTHTTYNICRILYKFANINFRNFLFGWFFSKKILTNSMVIIKKTLYNSTADWKSNGKKKRLSRLN